MANLTGKINLAKLEKVFITKGKSGQPLLVIDVKGSNLFEGKDGNIYLDLNLWERDKPEDIEKFGLYSIKQSFSKEIREADKKADIKRPYLGNADVFKSQESAGATEVKPEDVFNPNTEDLPF
jgi:hypothetical protein